MSNVDGNCGEKRCCIYEIDFIDAIKGDDPFSCYELLTLSPAFLQAEGHGSRDIIQMTTYRLESSVLRCALPPSNVEVSFDEYQWHAGRV
jgi:hypothetical protein